MFSVCVMTADRFHSGAKYRFLFLLAGMISHLFAALTREISYVPATQT